MVDLTSSSGLPIELDLKNNELHFGDGIIVWTTKKRLAREMKKVLLDNPSIPDDTCLYFMYDGVCRESDKELISGKGLRYDLTLICPGKLGREFVKTAGHYHSISEDGVLSYPELYEVLYGEVHFILQKLGTTEGGIADLLLIRAGRGERVMVPPNYGHVAINPLSEPLVLANWIADDCKPDYEAIAGFGGAALFEIEEEGEVNFIQNKNYISVPSLREVKIPSTSPLQFNDIPLLYEILVKRPDALDCLWSPRIAIEEFEDYIKRKIKKI